jgi:hypothetical protein
MRGVVALKKKEIKEMLKILDDSVNALKFDLDQLYAIYGLVKGGAFSDIVVKSQFIYWAEEMLRNIKHLRERLLEFKKKVGKSDKVNFS